MLQNLRLKAEIRPLKYKEELQNGHIRCGGLNISYTNPLSLYYEMKDIFIDEIYRFKSKSESPCIIDAGACIGVSVLYFKHIYPKAQIIAFEPDKKIFNVLEKNIRANSINDVQLINSGLGREDKELEFYSDGSDGGSLYGNGSNEVIKIKVEKLSKYMDRPIDLLKMNIEGSETEVFKEIKDKLDNVDQIILEYHCFHNLQQGLGDILNILDSKGFRYVVTDATNAKIPVPFELNQDYKLFNLVYAKKMK